MAGGILLAALSASFINMTEASDVIPPAEQDQVAEVLEDNAQLVSTTDLEELLAEQPDEIQQEIIDINTDAGDIALQVAMLRPILACLLGFLNSFRLMRLPDIKPTASSRRTGPGLIPGSQARRVWGLQRSPHCLRRAPDGRIGAYSAPAWRWL